MQPPCQLPTTLVTGATGRLGHLVVERLLRRGQPVRVFTRRPELAYRLFGAALEIRRGDFGDVASVEAALTGVQRLFLLSPLDECLTTREIAFAHAAAAAGVQRIVKLSGPDWVIDPPGRSMAGDAHAAVEWHLRGLPVEHVVLRPNIWMQSWLPPLVRQAAAGQALRTTQGPAGIAFVDVRDVADIAVEQLLATLPAGRPIVLTGAEPVGIRQIAGLLAQLLHRPVGVADADAGITPLRGSDFAARAAAELDALIRAGHAAYPTNPVSRLLGRAPRSVAGFLAEELGAEAAAAVPHRAAQPG